MQQNDYKKPEKTKITFRILVRQKRIKCHSSKHNVMQNDLRISSSVGDTPAFIRNPTSLRESGFSATSEKI